MGPSSEQSKIFLSAQQFKDSRKPDEKLPSWLMKPPRFKSGSQSTKVISHTLQSESEVIKSVDNVVIANALLAARLCFKNELKKKESKKIKLIDYIPDYTTSTKTNPTKKKQCAALCMNGNPCPFSATQGKFCKRHKVEVTDVL